MRMMNVHENMAMIDDDECQRKYGNDETMTNVDENMAMISF